jgi:hypothetical protein
MPGYGCARDSNPNRRIKRRARPRLRRSESVRILGWPDAVPSDSSGVVRNCAVALLPCGEHSGATATGKVRGSDVKQ